MVVKPQFSYNWINIREGIEKESTQSLSAGYVTPQNSCVGN
jgi:hypothetical protein